MISVQIGNPWAIEAFIDPVTQEQKWRPAPGERVTEFFYPDIPEDHPDGAWTPVKVATSIIHQMSWHMLPDKVPVWIESNDAVTKAILVDHFRIDPKKKRPKTWGDGTNGPYEKTAAAGTKE